MVTGRHDELERAALRFQVAVAEESVAQRPGDVDALRFLAHGYTALGRLEEGLGADRKLVELLPRDPQARYNLACSQSLCGRREEALASLASACELGFSDLKLLRTDHDLDPIRSDPRFAAILEGVERRRPG